MNERMETIDYLDRIEDGATSAAGAAAVLRSAIATYQHALRIARDALKKFSRQKKTRKKMPPDLAYALKVINAVSEDREPE